MTGRIDVGTDTVRRPARDFGEPIISPTPRTSVTACRTRTTPVSVLMSCRCRAATSPRRRQANVVMRISARYRVVDGVGEGEDLGDVEHRAFGAIHGAGAGVRDGHQGARATSTTTAGAGVSGVTGAGSHPSKLKLVGDSAAEPRLPTEGTKQLAGPCSGGDEHSST